MVREREEGGVEGGGVVLMAEGLCGNGYSNTPYNCLPSIFLRRQFALTTSCECVRDYLLYLRVLMTATELETKTKSG